MKKALLLCWCLSAGLTGKLPFVAVGHAAPPPTEPFLAAYVPLSLLLENKTDADSRDQAIAECLTQMKSCGLNTVMPHLTDVGGRAYYPSQIITNRPWGDWDPMVVLQREARRLGLRVYAKLNIMTSGDKTPAGILLEHPEWALRSVTGERVGYISPAHPQARAWVAAVCTEIVTRYQPDGLLLDHVRFPGEPVQLDPAAAKKHPLPGPSADAAEKKAFQQFKVDQLTEQMRLISQSARKAKPDLRIALYSWGPMVVTGNPSQNWPAWGKLGYVDILNVSGYCFTNNFGPKYLDAFAKRMRETVTLNREVGEPMLVTFALGVKTSHGEIHQASEVDDYLKLASENGVKGVAFFTWNALVPFAEEVRRAHYVSDFDRRTRPQAP